MPEAPRTTGREWLSLGPASRVVGVDPGTLRRWADDGRVVSFTTPGEYVLLGRASDRVIFTDKLVTITVTGATPR